MGCEWGSSVGGKTVCMFGLNSLIWSNRKLCHHWSFSYLSWISLWDTITCFEEESYGLDKENQKLKGLFAGGRWWKLIFHPDHDAKALIFLSVLVVGEFFKVFNMVTETEWGWLWLEIWDSQTDPNGFCSSGHWTGWCDEHVMTIRFQFFETV